MSRQNMVFGFSAIQLATMTLCLGAPLISQAQSAEPAGGPALPAVTVSAVRDADSPTGPGNGYVAKRSLAGTKTDTPLVETPQSISVVTREQMDAQAAQTLDAALRYTPGVYSQDNDLRFDQLSARGFDLDSYLDGLKLVKTATWFVTPRIDTSLLDRVEVLHGPASVLYGQAAPGGVVNMVSKRPTEEAFHRIDFQAGNNDRYQVGFDMGGPVDADGKVLYRVTGLGRYAGTQTDHVREERYAIAPSVTIKPGADTTLTILTSLQHDPAGGLFNPVPLAAASGINPNGRISSKSYFGDPQRDHMERTQGTLAYIFEHRFSDALTVRQNVRYLHDDIDYYQTSITGPLAADNRTVPIWSNINREHLTNFAVDNQAQIRFNTGALAHTTLVGIDYQRTLGGVNRGGAVTGSINIYNPNFAALSTAQITTFEDYSLTQVGAYLQDQVKLGNWSLQLGGRKDWTTSNDVQRTGAVTTVARQNDSAFTWRGGLTYQFDSGLAPYVSYAKSFQPTIGSNTGAAPFVPTTGKQYEAGVKFQPKNTDALFTLAVYDLRQQNVLTPDPVFPTRSVQTGEIRSRGIEFEAHANLTENLKAIASINKMVQDITRSNTATRGKRPVAQPGQMASAWLDYTIHGGSLDKLGFAGGVRYVGSSYGTADNLTTVGGRTLFDAAIHYDYDQHWKFALNAANLFNKEYLAYCSNGFLCYWGATRTVLATARYQW